MWMMTQQPAPDDHVVSTGETHSVREFRQIAFRKVGLNYKDRVVTDPSFYRPAEVDLLVGNPAKAKRILGWSYSRTFEQLIDEMVENDCRRVRDHN